MATTVPRYSQQRFK